MEAFAVLARHYDPSGPSYGLLVTHSILVARKARQLAAGYMARRPEVEVDLDFLTEAALLHDIGIKECDAPSIHCTGSAPYIQHGPIGRRMLEAEGLPKHALVCERHTGSGLTKEDVKQQKLPLEERDYLPVSIEEKLICVADKFYSKNPKRLFREKPLSKVHKSLSKYGEAAAQRWLELIDAIL